LELDLFRGEAWIGLVPFLLTGLRPSFFTTLPWLSRFPETNLRTYVRGPDGKPAVWFYTLEADRLAAVLGARATFGLPYRWASMAVETQPDRVVYTSTRHPGSRPAHSRIAVRPGLPAAAGELDLFLTARYRLYSRLLGMLVYADVEHAPWPLHRAELMTLDEDLFHACGLPQPEGDPLLLYSPGVDVRVGVVRRIP
jgi:uncharacterized protein YqjF (DUF2071 family)